MNVVKFKSTPDNFRKEKNGSKQCTVRVFDDPEDPRKVLLDAWINGNISDLGVMIENTEFQSFQDVYYDATDVSKLPVFGAGDVYIISWKWVA